MKDSSITPLFHLTVEQFEELNRRLLSEATDQILLKIGQNQKPETEESDLCRIKTAANITGYTVSTIYSLVFEDAIPHTKPEGSNFLWFSRKELEDWKTNRKTKGAPKPKSKFEIDSDEYLVSLRKKRKKNTR